MSLSIFPKIIDINQYLYKFDNDLSVTFEEPKLTIFNLINDSDKWSSGDNVNYLDSYAYMRTLPTLDEVFNSTYFIDNFLVRYQYNIPLFAKEVCNTSLTWQQVEICKNHDPYGGRLTVPSGHGCGKTKLIGILTLHHLLCTRKSITRIQAPKLEQITKLSFGEVISAIDGMKMDVKFGEKLIPNQWSFLANFIIVTTRLIYVKNHKTQWYVESAVAKRGESNSLSGQHNWSYLLILDEACGIEDGHVIASLGGLSEERNSCIAFSQHANTTSLFHLWVTTLSVENGGVWKLVRLNSEESPLVSDKALENWYASYTEDEYRVRVLGLFPLNETGNLFSLANIQSIYKIDKNWINSIFWTSRTYVTDIAYKGLRDSSVTINAKVTKITNLMGFERLYVDVTDVKVFHKETKLRPTEVGERAINDMIDEVYDDGIEYHEYLQGVDATAGGNETYLVMEDKAIEVKEEIADIDIEVFAIEWGGNRRMSNKERKEFVNERAKGYVNLRKAIADNRFIISTKKYQTRIQREMENIPFKFDAKYRYQMESKKDMAVASPDILDCFAMLFTLPFMDSSDENESLVKDIKMRVKEVNRTDKEAIKKKREELEELEELESEENVIEEFSITSVVF